MTLLQTRVDDKTAARFKKAARERGITPYDLLQRLVSEASETPSQNTWENHWDRLAAVKLQQADKTMSELRAEADER